MNKFRITEGEGKGTEFEELNIVKARTKARKLGFRHCIVEEVRSISEEEKAYYECKEFMSAVHNENVDPRSKIVGRGATDFMKLIVTGDAGDNYVTNRPMPSDETIELGREFAKELGPSIYSKFNSFFLNMMTMERG